MNLRILKKLSKRAAPYLPLLGDDREQFRARAGENYMKTVIRDRKHFERGRSVHADILRGETKWPAKDGRGWIYAHSPDHPRAGTIMVGGMSGYYEPEWDEETAWCALYSIVFEYFTDFASDGDCESEDWPRAFLTRDLSMPSRIFEAADDMVAERRARAG